MKGSLTYTRITGKALAKALIDEKGYNVVDFPSENTLINMLNRMGYNLKRVLKSKPAKKIKEVDEIFENVWKENRESDENPESLRISIDAKAKVNIGKFSRNGKSRDREAKKAEDHDMNPEMKLVPYGILDVLSGMLSIFFGTSFETSDFIVDCLEMWWKTNSIAYPHIKELVINLDNGPNSASGRTQFIRRMTEFSDKTGLRIRLVYYPPYHSKYNPIERCWGILEEHWNGEILDSISKTVNWACTMTWKGIKPVVTLLEKSYMKGIRLTKKEMKPYENRIQRSNTLPKWDVLIETGVGQIISCEFPQKMDLRINIAFFQEIFDFLSQNTTGNETGLSITFHSKLPLAVNSQIGLSPNNDDFVKNHEIILPPSMSFAIITIVKRSFHFTNKSMVTPQSPSWHGHA